MESRSTKGSRNAVFVVAAAAFIITMAVNLQMPLYPSYASKAGYGAGVLGLVFSCYVAGLLPILILFGGISDRIGRKAAIQLALIAAMFATGLVYWHPTLEMLSVARVFQGMGVGLGVGACSAYLSEIIQSSNASQKAAAYITFGTSLGFGMGALLTSGLVAWKPTLTPASYWLYLPIALLFVWLVECIPSRGRNAKVAWIRLPHVDRNVLSFCAAIFIAWAITGIVIVVVPIELAKMGKSGWSGLALFLVNGVGALCQPIARKIQPQLALLCGLITASLGVSLVVLGLHLGQIGLSLFGAAVSGSACYGFTYLGGLASVMALAGQEKARAASGYFLFAYLGFSMPVILTGFLSDQFGTMATLTGFVVFVIIANIAITYSLRTQIFYSYKILDGRP